MTQLSTLRNSHLYNQIFPIIWSEFDRVFDGFFGDKNILNRVKQSGYPRLEISNTDHQFRVKASVPGIAKEDLLIERDGSVVTISGSSMNEKSEEGTVFHVRELAKSKFSRSFTLPEGVKVGEEPIVQLRDGILLLVWNYDNPGDTIPGPKRIEIR